MVCKCAATSISTIAVVVLLVDIKMVFDLKIPTILLTVDVDNLSTKSGYRLTGVAND